jgi:uncharacterized phage-like protein YoqJ
MLLKHEKHDGIAVYILKETILKEMEAKIEEGNLFFLILLLQTQ